MKDHKIIIICVIKKSYLILLVYSGGQNLGYHLSSFTKFKKSSITGRKYTGKNGSKQYLVS